MVPDGVGTEIYWTPTMNGTKGIAGTTPQTLTERWYQYSKNKPVPQGIGWAYAVMQTLFDAIERAGSLKPEAVTAVLPSTDLTSMWGRVAFVMPEQHSTAAAAYGQWQKTNNPWVWESPVIYSQHDLLKATGTFIYPKPWN